MDRGGQLGALRARVNAGYDQLVDLLHGGLVVYAEWLWTHTVCYDNLPDTLVLLDLWDGESRFLGLGDRDRLASRRASRRSRSPPGRSRWPGWCR